MVNERMALEYFGRHLACSRDRRVSLAADLHLPDRGCVLRPGACGQSGPDVQAAAIGVLLLPLQADLAAVLAGPCFRDLGTPSCGVPGGRLHGAALMSACWVPAAVRLSSAGVLRGPAVVTTSPTAGPGGAWCW